MATGDTSFSSAGLSPKKVSFPPLPPGEYELRLNGPSCEVGKKDEPGKMPYVRASFTIEGHNFASGKARTQTVWFLTDMTPAKDGVSNPMRANQILGFAKSAGVDITAGIVAVDKGDGTTSDCINPQQMLAYLQGLDGTVVKARLKIEKSKDYDPSNKVDFFVPSESEVTFEG